MNKFPKNGLSGVSSAELSWFTGDWLGQNEPGRRSCRPNGSRAKHCGAVKKQAGSFDLSMVAR